MKKIAAVEYSGDLRTDNIHLKSGAHFISDAPIDNHGKGEAFSPTDLLATSLANCAITVMAIYAGRQNIKITLMKAEVYKEMTAAPRRLDKLAVHFSISGAINGQERDNLIDIAKNCPVALSLHPTIEHDFHFIWND